MGLEHSVSTIPADIRELLHGIAPVDDKAAVRLDRYVAILTKWQQTLNLIAPSTVVDIWRRHIVDCWQLAPIVRRYASAGQVLDIGSGAGLPGIVLAIAGWQSVMLVEANARKGAFLRAACQAVGITAAVHTARIEQLSAMAIISPKVIMARALASLDRLLELALPIMAPSTVLVLPKGRTWKKEVDAAKYRYRFFVEALPSVTSRESAIIVIYNIEKR